MSFNLRIGSCKLFFKIFCKSTDDIIRDIQDPVLVCSLTWQCTISNSMITNLNERRSERWEKNGWLRIFHTMRKNSKKNLFPILTNEIFICWNWNALAYWIWNLLHYQLKPLVHIQAVVPYPWIIIAIEEAIMDGWQYIWLASYHTHRKADNTIFPIFIESS